MTIKLFLEFAQLAFRTHQATGASALESEDPNNFPNLLG